jgi:Tfp pilus assembly protein PilF
MKRNDFKNAERAFLKSIEQMPDSPSAMVNLASLYRLEGQTQRSNLYIRRALDVSAANGDQEALKERLRALYRLWDQHQAIIFMEPF